MFVFFKTNFYCSFNAKPMRIAIFSFSSCSEFVDMRTHSDGLGRRHSELPKFKKVFSAWQEWFAKTCKIFEAILPLFEGNMRYFSISSCSRVYGSLI